MRSFRNRRLQSQFDCCDRYVGPEMKLETVCLEKIAGTAKYCWGRHAEKSLKHKT